MRIYENSENRYVVVISNQKKRSVLWSAGINPKTFSPILVLAEEVLEWLIVHSPNCHFSQMDWNYRDGDTVELDFDNEEDAVHFKLRWG